MVPADPRKPWDVRAVLARLLDGSRFDEFKKQYGTTLVTGFGKLYGQPIGIVANAGVLFSESALKGLQSLMQVCFWLSAICIVVCRAALIIPTTLSAKLDA